MPTPRKTIPPTIEAIDQFCSAFDHLFGRSEERQAVRQYLIGLLLPREHNKTIVELAAIVSGEPACPGHLRLDAVRDRNRKRDAVPGNRLKIAIINPIKNGVAPEVVRCVQGQPKTGPKIVADMRLRGPNRVLAPNMAA